MQIPHPKQTNKQNIHSVSYFTSWPLVHLFIYFFLFNVKTLLNISFSISIFCNEFIIFPSNFSFFYPTSCVQSCCPTFAFYITSLLLQHSSFLWLSLGVNKTLAWDNHVVANAAAQVVGLLSSYSSVTTGKSKPVDYI